MARSRAPATLALAALLAGVSLAGCSGSSSPDCSPTTTKASVLATARSWYLFDTLIPATGLDPADAAQTPADFLDAITAEARAQDLDRHFSFLSTKTATAQLFDEGTSVGFGIGFRYVGSTQAFVTQVFGDAQVPGGSPAARAGLARGDELVAIAPGTAGPGGAPAPSAAELDKPERQVSAILTATPGNLTPAFGPKVVGTVRDFRVRRVDGTLADLQATAATYSLDPVPRAAAPIVLDVAAAASDTGVAKKVGYLTLRTFIGPAFTPLRQAFAAFKGQGVTDLIIDLRYDGGGRLDVASTFLDLLRAGHAGEVKFGLRNNVQHPEANFDDPYRTEASALAPARVAFIVTEGSASASELLPYALVADMGAEVALIGSPTFGKPVGQYQFASRDCDLVLALLGFRLTNRVATAAYFSGLPDAAWAGSSCAAEDDLTHPNGDPAEASTGAALRWIADKSCAGGPIPATSAVARLARQAAAPGAPEPTLEQRFIPGLF